MNIYEMIKTFFEIIASIIPILLFYKVFYKIIGFFTTRKFKKTDNFHKYAVVIAARNEEKVIGNLIDSIMSQDYQGPKTQVFVVADNCTDNTAAVAREHGAVCYERTDNKNRTKGFALKYLFEQIEKDYKTESFEGYFVFDADNLLEKDYISRMNEAFDSGEKIITSYRNTKNLNDNWIAASYAIHWLRCCRNNHRPRSLFRLATNLQGTGFLFASELVKDGWKYTSFTEDRAFSADAAAKGYKISYNEAAVFYDEQPTSLRIALRQRIRWAKGHLMAFRESGFALFKSIFKLKSFACYDMLCQITPFPVFYLFRRWLLHIAGMVYYCTISNTTLTKTVLKIFNITVTTNGLFAVILTLTLFLIIDFAVSYLVNTLMAVYVLFIERKKLQKISFFKKLWYIFMWPWFDIIGGYALVAALFVKVEWKPIPHTNDIKIEELKKQ